MKTVVLGPLPAELEALIARRRKLGLDRYDEIWAGDYHMAPAAHFWHGRVDSELARVLAPHARRVGLLGTTTFNLGSPDNIRVPDGGLHRSIANSAWLPTAAIVIEVVSPDDETWDKLEFYASHGVAELIIADPQTRDLHWFARRSDGTGYLPIERSALLEIDVAEITAQIDWPQAD